MHRTPATLAILVLHLLGAAATRADLRMTGTVSDIDESPRCADQHPDTAPLAGGGFIAVWDERIVLPSRIAGRFLDRDGRPRGPELVLVTGDNLVHPKVAVDSGGNFMVIWRSRSIGVLQGRVFSAAGTPLGREFLIAHIHPFFGHATLLAERGGGFSVLWSTDAGLQRHRFDAAGRSLGTAETILAQPISFYAAATPHGDHGAVVVDWEQGGRLQGRIFHPGAEPVPFLVQIDQTPDPTFYGPEGPVVAVAGRPDGVFLVAWRDSIGLNPTLWVRTFDGTGRPLGEARRADDGTDLSFYVLGLDAAADSSGELVVAWQKGFGRGDDLALDLAVRAFGPDGSPLGPVVSAFQGGFPRGDATFPALAAGREDQVLLTWQRGRYDVDFSPTPCFGGGIRARPLRVTCTGGGRLCLQRGRFEVRVSRTNPDGSSGEAHAADLTEETGTFWFFGPDNVELAVKILDGRTYNGHFWVFYGSLSDTGYTVTVTDTVTGAAKSYVNPPSTLASRSDTAAFPSPGPAGGASPAQATAASHLPPRGGAGPCTDPTLPFAIRPGLCLNRERFEVEVAWHDPFNGTSGIATGVPLTEDSGYFWFFGPDNLELVVKVLDGRSYNGKYWVFYGALTNVEYTIRVYHPASRTERIYHNPPYQFRSHSDIDAFSLP